VVILLQFSLDLYPSASHLDLIFGTPRNSAQAKLFWATALTADYA